MRDKSFIIGALRELAVGIDEQPIMRVFANDAFNWSSLGRCSNCGLPGLDVGQRRDCRYATDGDEGLHAHDHGAFVDFHLDRIDPRNDIIGHGVADTLLVAGATLGAFVGALLGAAGGKSGATTGAVGGMVVGGLVGAHQPKKEFRVFLFRDLATAASQYASTAAW